jgi:hypothetical protein
MKLIKRIITVVILWFLIQFLFFGGLVVCERAEKRISGKEQSKVSIVENGDNLEFYILEKQIFSVRNVFKNLGIR